MRRLVGALPVSQRLRFRSHLRTLHFYEDCLALAVPGIRRADGLSPHDLRDRDPTTS